MEKRKSTLQRKMQPHYVYSVRFVIVNTLESMYYFWFVVSHKLAIRAEKTQHEQPTSLTRENTRNTKHDT